MSLVHALGADMSKLPEPGDLRRFDGLVHIVTEQFATIGFKTPCIPEDHYIYDGQSSVERGPFEHPTCLVCAAAKKP